MLVFFQRLYELVRPYRMRLALGVLTGIIAGLIEPLMLLTLVMVFTIIFPSADPGELEKRLHSLPTFIREWIQSAQ